ncbi:HalOD1 output domain-containing protein [Haloplanus salilacus]|uniref:HalOD1 output domain-containing protein n=1 Tax=Haloplanus salilacus TaxID=2949994 RepID=UPI0030D56DBB
MTENEPGSAAGAGNDESTIRGDSPHRVSGADTPETDASETDGSVHRTPYDASTDGSLGAAVVVAIADATGVPTHDIDPLYETVDPDALAALFAPTTTGGARRRGVVSFAHYGCHVTVDEDEIVVDTGRSEC